MYAHKDIHQKASDYGDTACIHINEISVGSDKCNEYVQKQDELKNQEVMWRDCAMACFLRIAFWYGSHSKTWLHLLTDIVEEAEEKDPKGFAMDGFESAIFSQFYLGAENQAKLQGQHHCAGHRGLKSNDWSDVAEAGGFCNEYAQNKQSQMNVPIKYSDADIAIEDLWTECAIGCYAMTAQERGWAGHKWNDFEKAIQEVAEKYDTFFDEQTVQSFADNWHDSAQDAALYNAKQWGQMYYSEGNVLECGALFIREDEWGVRFESPEMRTEFIKLFRTECAKAFVDDACAQIKSEADFREELKKKLKQLYDADRIYDLIEYEDSVHCHFLKSQHNSN